MLAEKEDTEQSWPSLFANMRGAFSYSGLVFCLSVLLCQTLVTVNNCRIPGKTCIYSANVNHDLPSYNVLYVLIRVPLDRFRADLLASVCDV